MLRGKGTVTYVDGERQVPFVVLPFDLSRAERWLALHGLVIDPEQPGKAATTHALLLAHSALQRAGDVNGVGFETWAETVLDVDLELTPTNPTPAATSDG